MVEAGEAWGLWQHQRPVASALTLAYGGRFAWISMVLVSRDWRRRGIATALLRGAIDRLRSQNLIAGLDATEAGREIYLPLGFSDIYPLARLALASTKSIPQQPIAPPQGIVVRPLYDDDLPDLIARDAAVFGAERRLLLEALYRRLPRCAHIARTDDGQIAGFVLGRNGREASQIGPLVAESESIAKVLFNSALATLSGAVFIDVVDLQRSWKQFLQPQGFVFQRGFMRMLLGRDTAFDDTERVFAVAGPELG